MKRRRFLDLTAVSATSVVCTALAGCTGSAGSGGDPGTTTTSTNSDSDSDETTTALPCPQVRDVSLHVCPGDDGGPISVDRSDHEMPADGGTITVTVTNTSDGGIGLNPYAWAVHRLNDDGHWKRVDDDRVHIEPWQELASGESIRWRIASDADYKATGGAIGCSLDLEPGTYGWSIELKHGSKDKRVAAAAGFYVR